MLAALRRIDDLVQRTCFAPLFAWLTATGNFSNLRLVQNSSFDQLFQRLLGLR